MEQDNKTTYLVLLGLIGIGLISWGFLAPVSTYISSFKQAETCGLAGNQANVTATDPVTVTGVVSLSRDADILAVRKDTVYEGGTLTLHIETEQASVEESPCGYRIEDIDPQVNYTAELEPPRDIESLRVLHNGQQIATIDATERFGHHLTAKEV